MSSPPKGAWVLALELVVVLGTAVLLGTVVGRRTGVAPPVVLLLGGVLLGFVPALREVRLPPEVVLLLFLPALLYWESLTTSLREIRRSLRGIVLMSTVLVIATAAAVAAVAHAFGLAWGPAWVLGAAVAPTDATAVGVLAGMLPRRNITSLRAESLVNDGTALVVYGLAVGITVGEEALTAPHIGWMFLVSYVGGALAGIASAWVGAQVRRPLDDPMLASVVMLIIPFAAFLLAEWLGASGVLSVVVCGLIMSQVGPRIGRAAARLQTVESFTLAAFLLNGSLFVLIGLEAQTVVRGLSGDALRDGLVIVGAVFVTLFTVRLAFLFASAYLIRLLDRRPEQKLRRVSDRARIVSAVAGFRGAVSLAAALGVPTAIASGAPFPDRNMIIFVTFGVIVMTLVVGGLLFPAVVRWAGFPEDTGVREESTFAQTTAVREALEALPGIAEDLGTSPEAVERLRHEYETHLLLLDTDDERSATAARQDRDYTSLRLAMLTHKRATILRLRDERRIDDEVLRGLQAVLDIEEIRLTSNPTNR